jgi:hypothetical protein
MELGIGNQLCGVRSGSRRDHNQFSKLSQKFTNNISVGCRSVRCAVVQIAVLSL